MANQGHGLSPDSADAPDSIRMQGELLLLEKLLEANALSAALRVAGAVVAGGGLLPDPRLVDRLTGRMRAVTGADPLPVMLPEIPMTPVPGRVLHVLTDVHTRDGSEDSDFATAAKCEQMLGLDPYAVTEMGVGDADDYRVDEVGGVKFQRIPGRHRGLHELDRWQADFAGKLAAVVRKLRPEAIVAGPELVSAHAASAVADAYGLPLMLVGVLRDSNADSWTVEGRQRLRLRAADSCGSPTLGGLAGIYKRAGLLPEGALRVAALERDDAALVAIRRRLKSESPPPLEREYLSDSDESAQTIMAGTWRWASFPSLELSPPIAWQSLPVSNRSHAFHLHCWEMMKPVLGRFVTTGDEAAIKWCLELATSWCAEYVAQEPEDSGMAWYDMALALRFPKLAFLFQEALTRELPEVDVLCRAVLRHQQEIFRSRAFSAHNNHGFFTAVGQLAAARRLKEMPAMDVIAKQGEARLRTVQETQFAEDGGHLEHSPEYHRMLTDSFAKAGMDGLLSDPALLERVRKAQDVMGWFIRPDLTVEQIGDSSRVELDREGPMLTSPTTAFLLTRGETGNPNPEQVKSLPHAGYGFVRSPQPLGRDDHRDSSYLTLMAGFHSRSHKHADDLSVTWFDAGVELLVDAGRFGYLDPLPADSPEREMGFFYSRPERQYVESSMAHNTVTVDGKDHDRRGRVPYGSGVGEASERDGFFRLVGEVDHSHWTHRRALVLQPGRWLLAEDDLEFHDDEEHDVATWWNLAGENTLVSTTPQSAHFRLTNGQSFQIEDLSDGAQLSAVLGQEQPLRGWRSRQDLEFTPAWSVCAGRTARRRVKSRTLLHLADAPVKGVPSHPWTS